MRALAGTATPMVAVPLKAELSGEALRRTIGVVETCVVAVALYAAAGRLDDRSFGPWQVLAIAGAALLLVALYSLLPPRVSTKLERMQALDRSADHASPKRAPWFWAWAIGGGLVLGGIGLLFDIGPDTLAIFVAIALGATIGGPAYDAWTVARYEREHDGTVYRVEDPPGTEAGLAWLPRAGE